jgi:hypothetical protein
LDTDIDPDVTPFRREVTGLAIEAGP